MRSMIPEKIRKKRRPRPKNLTIETTKVDGTRAADKTSEPAVGGSEQPWAPHEED
jgi:hypothetical protein